MVRTCLKIFFLSVAVMPYLLRSAAFADVLSGSIELYQQTSSDTSTDSTGLTTDSRSNLFLQRYNLNFYNMIYPYLNLRAGIRVDKQSADQRTDGVESDVDSTLLLPSIGLTLRTPFLWAGVGYDKRVEKQESGGWSTKDFRETASGFLGVQPAGLPSLDVQVVDQKLYDRERQVHDRDVDSLSISSVYQPINSIDLSYRVLFSEEENRLNDTETDGVTQSGRASYSDSFWGGRAVLSTSYNFVRNDTDRKTQFNTTGTGAGISHLQVYPVAGLSGITDTAAVGSLDINAALIDGNLTASTGLNIGSAPSLAGDTRQRNAGIDFGTVTEVNSLFVWVDRALPDIVSRSFAWEIYTSADNQNWTLVQTVFPAVFGSFDNRFEISFSTVKARYVKAVTRPLSVAVTVPVGTDVSTIYITEVQAFVDKPLQSGTGQQTQSDMSQSEYADVSGRFYFIRSPRSSFYYDLYYQDRKAEQSGQTARSDSLIHSLVGSARFSPVFTGVAKIMRENDDNADSTSRRYVEYEGSLLAEARSLPKLRHTLTTTGKREEWNDQFGETTKDTVSFYATNDAEIYPGITALLAGGESLSSAVTRTIVTRIDSGLIGFGLSFVPHRTVLINITYNWTESEQQVSGGTETTNTTRVSDFNASYNPFSTLYIYGSIIEYEQTGRPSRTTRTLSGSWAFQQNRGTLEIRFTYNEDYESDTDTRNRLLGPYVRWKMNPRMYLESAYMIATSDSPAIHTDTKSITTGFKVYF